MLFDMFRKEWDTTFSSHGIECADWTEFYNHWIDLIKSIIKIVPEGMQGQSLMCIRFLELNRDILWSLFATMVGAYENAVRELRFWFEVILQAYLVDHRGGITRLSGNVEKITGSRLIKECNFKNQYNLRLKQLYGELCKFVHPTRQELNLDSSDPRVTFQYDEESFERNRELHTKTYDAILFIVMASFPEAAKDYYRKHLTLESLHALGYELSLKYLNELGNDLS